MRHHIPGRRYDLYRLATRPQAIKPRFEACPICDRPVFGINHAKCAEKWLKALDAKGNPSNRKGIKE